MLIKDLVYAAHTLSAGEFADLMAQLRAEETHREQSAKREAWKAVTDAIEYYIEEYGQIEVHDVCEESTIYIEGRMIDYATPGEIRVGA